MDFRCINNQSNQVCQVRYQWFNTCITKECHKSKLRLKRTWMTFTHGNVKVDISLFIISLLFGFSHSCVCIQWVSTNSTLISQREKILIANIQIPNMEMTPIILYTENITGIIMTPINIGPIWYISLSRDYGTGIIQYTIRFACNSKTIWGMISIKVTPHQQQTVGCFCF